MDVDDAAMKQFEEGGSGERIRSLLRAEIEDLEKRIDATHAALESLPEAETEDRTADLLRLEGEKA